MNGMETIPSFEELDSSVQEQLDLKTFQVNLRFSFGFVLLIMNRENSTWKNSLAQYQKSLYQTQKQIPGVCISYFTLMNIE